MKRLTEKYIDRENKTQYQNACGINEFEYCGGREEMFNKLGQLEDLEEKLGINLATLFEALSQKVYIKDEFGLIKPIFIEHFVLSMKGEELHTRGRTSAMHDKKGKILGFVSTPNTYGEYHFGLKDYGKTWALTKEELEK